MSQDMNDDDIDIREYVEVVLRRWKTIVFFVIVMVFMAFVYSLRQAPVYEASATVLVRGGGASSLSQYAGVAGMLGLNLGGGGNIEDLTELLKSKIIAAKVLDGLKLTQRIPGWDNPEIKRQNLISAVSGMVKTPKVSGKVLEIKTVSSDPQLAADLANGFVDALSFYWNELNYSEAQKKLQYIDSELPRVEKDLKTIENKLKLVPRADTGFSLSGQSGVQRDYDIYNSVYIMLKKELESAKLEASKEIPPFSVVDRAEKPFSKSGPKVKLNVIVGLVLGLFVGIFMAFFMEYWEKGNNR